MPTKLTVEELTRLPEDDLFHELDEGELLTRPPSCIQHSDVSAEIVCQLANHVKQNSLGRCYGANTGFLLGPDTVPPPTPPSSAKRASAPLTTAPFSPAPPISPSKSSPPPTPSRS